MLVLGRYEGESVMIDGGIEVTVVKLRGSTVKLGFTAPDGTRIVRTEIAGGNAGRDNGTREDEPVR